MHAINISLGEGVDIRKSLYLAIFTTHFGKYPENKDILARKAKIKQGSRHNVYTGEKLYFDRRYIVENDPIWKC